MYRRLGFVGIVLGFASAAAPAFQAGDGVKISGGVSDASGQNYSWTLTNGTSSPVVFVRFPHYWADTFIPPGGWGQRCTNLQQVGAKGEPGICEAAAPEGAGIAPGQSAEFQMRLARGSPALRREGTVLVRFADGTEQAIAGVELPTQAAFLERNIQGLALAGIFLIVALVAIAKKRNRNPAPGEETP